MSANNVVVTIKALDGLVARAEVTAQNIANANTRNYRPMRVSFEDALRSAAAIGDDAVADVQPLVAAVPKDATSNGELRLDLEMGNASTTALRYGALVTILGRELQLNALAASGTR